MKKDSQSLWRVLLMCLGWPRGGGCQLRDFLGVALKRKLIEARSIPMMEGAAKVGEMRVRDVMIPHSQIVVIDRAASLDDALGVVATHGHSRYPVTGDTRDHVVGVLLAKDLLADIQKNKENAGRRFSIQEHVRPAVLVPESKRLNVLLEEFKKNRNHMAIVVDEHGGVSGLITVEDVVEQIVGDIEDEHDTEATANIRRDGGIWLVNGATPMEEFNKYFSQDIRSADGSVAGVVIRALGHLPETGDTAVAHGFSFKVARADDRRVHLVEVAYLDAP